jgi:hypothetical protein
MSKKSSNTEIYDLGTNLYYNGLYIHELYAQACVIIKDRQNTKRAWSDLTTFDDFCFYFPIYTLLLYTLYII